VPPAGLDYPNRKEFQTCEADIMEFGLADSVPGTSCIGGALGSRSDGEQRQQKVGSHRQRQG
jgi:hypothetical protein